MGKTDWLEETMLDHVLRDLVHSPSLSVFVALTYTATTDAGGGTELSGGGYARQQVTFSVPVQVDGAAQVSNTVEVLFPEATADWLTATHFFIANAATLGDRLYHEQLDVARTAKLGQQLRFPVGALVVTES